jgi:hypothetical protein
LAELVERLDTGARWAGDSLVLPELGVQLYVDSFAAFRSASLISAGGRQSHQGWRRLETALDEVLARENVTRNPRGIGLISIGLLILVMLVAAIAKNPQAVAQTLLDIARLLQSMVGL